MVYFIVGIIIIMLVKELIYHFTGVEVNLVIVLLACFVCTIVFFVAIPNKIVQYTETEVCCSVESMDKNTVTIEGEKYDYELKYAEDAEVPYATLVEVGYPKWHQVLMVFKTNKTIAYVYTNDISAINGD